MISRQLSTKLTKFVKHFPALAILGPRQVGKTTLAKNLLPKIKKQVIYLDLELPTDVNKLAKPEYYFNLNKDKCIIIDEVQRMPHLFPVLRGIIDKYRKPGRFILLGSASPDLLKKSSETLAGRIVYTELTPLNYLEVRYKATLNKLWIRGGFPEALLTDNDKIRKQWYHSFVKTYIEKDLPGLGLPTSHALMYRLVSMLAHNQGTIWNASSYSKSLGVSSPTVSNCLDFLENAYLVRRLQPYFINAKKRLVKSPKIYVRDSGLLHYLSGVTDMEDLLGNPVAGTSWEGFVIEQITSVAQDNFTYYYYRTQDGTECDLILAKGIKPFACIEIKLADAPTKTKSFATSIKDLKTKHNYIITPEGHDVYYVDDTIQVVSLKGFLLNILPKLYGK